MPPTFPVTMEVEVQLAGQGPACDPRPPRRGEKQVETGTFPLGTGARKWCPGKDRAQAHLWQQPQTPYIPNIPYGVGPSLQVAVPL